MLKTKLNLTETYNPIMGIGLWEQQEEFVAGGKAKMMPCGHPFHYDCLIEWLERHNRCVCVCVCARARARVRVCVCGPQNKC
jgi:hypothetical protein